MEKSSSSVKLKTTACDKMKKKNHLLCVMSYYEVMVWGGASYVYTGENFVIYVDSLFPLYPSPNY